jgi:hypothetical protein
MIATPNIALLRLIPFFFLLVEESFLKSIVCVYYAFWKISLTFCSHTFNLQGLFLITSCSCFIDVISFIFLSKKRRLNLRESLYLF